MIGSTAKLLSAALLWEGHLPPYLLAAVTVTCGLFLGISDGVAHPYYRDKAT